jgi:hypothetical protein
MDNHPPEMSHFESTTSMTHQWSVTLLLRYLEDWHVEIPAKEVDFFTKAQYFYREASRSKLTYPSCKIYFQNSGFLCSDILARFNAVFSGNVPQEETLVIESSRIFCHTSEAELAI